MRRHGGRVSGDWRVSANCQHSDPNALFVRGRRQHDAKSICSGCPVLAECLAHALDHRIEFGVWGGLTERERRALLRRRTDVDSWSEQLGAVAVIDASSVADASSGLDPGPGADAGPAADAGVGAGAGPVADASAAVSAGERRREVEHAA